MAETSRLLSERRLSHASVVLEEIQRLVPGPADDRWNETIGYRNLASLWSNYAAAGAERLLLERVLEQRSQLGEVEAAIAGARITVVRLRAPLAVIESRIRGRPEHVAGDWYIGAARWLTPRMDIWAVEDHVVENGADRQLREVAGDVLRVSGWVA